MKSLWKAVAPPHKGVLLPWPVESTARVGFAPFEAKHARFSIIANAALRNTMTNPSPSPEASAKHDADTSVVGVAG